MQSFSVLLVGENKWLLKALRALVESDPMFMVTGTCSLQDVLAKSEQLLPDMLVFLPEVSFMSCQEVLSTLRSEYFQPCLLLITPVDAALYESIIPSADAYQFISQSQINTDLLPRIRQYVSECQDTEHES